METSADEAETDDIERNKNQVVKHSKLIDENSINNESVQSKFQDLSDKVKELEDKVYNHEIKLSNFDNSSNNVRSVEDHILTPDRALTVKSSKSILRRRLIISLTNKMKSFRQNYDQQVRQQSSDMITISIPCSMTIFKWIVADLHTEFNNSIQYIPSLQNIFHDSKSVPSYHVLLGSFKNLCDWLLIRDISDRSVLAFKRATTTNNQGSIFRLIGGTMFDDQTKKVWYTVGADPYYIYNNTNSSGGSCSVLSRENMDWDDINNRYKHNLAIESNYNPFRDLMKSKFDYNDLFSSSIEICWNRLQEISKRILTEDVKDIDCCGELSLKVPLLYFMGHCVHELDQVLTSQVLHRLLVSSHTSIQPSIL